MTASGKTVKEIGSDLGLSIKTVSTYRTRVLEKLNLKTNADVIRYALREKLSGVNWVRHARSIV